MNFREVSRKIGTLLYKQIRVKNVWGYGEWKNVSESLVIRMVIIQGKC